MQVYLPEELYLQVKRQRLPASQLLQDAIVAEVRRRELEAHADAYLAELLAEVGEPTAAEHAAARRLADRLGDRPLTADVA
jgi:post-segregation antitoxin (ccd killing protein)